MVLQVRDFRIRGFANAGLSDKTSLVVIRASLPVGLLLKRIGQASVFSQVALACWSVRIVNAQEKHPRPSGQRVNVSRHRLWLGNGIGSRTDQFA